MRDISILLEVGFNFHGIVLSCIHHDQLPNFKRPCHPFHQRSRPATRFRLSHTWSSGQVIDRWMTFRVWGLETKKPPIPRSRHFKKNQSLTPVESSDSSALTFRQASLPKRILVNNSNVLYYIGGEVDLSHCVPNTLDDAIAKQSSSDF